jgi:hypothetical protein
MKLRTITHLLWLLPAFWIASCETDNRQITSDMIHFPPSGDGESADDAPLMTVDTINYNFGSIAIGEKVVHSYHFVNTGKSPLIIAQVTPSCGCTTSKDWPHEPIAPGEDGKITIEFNSKGFPGKIDKSISVLTNGIPKVIDLKLSGEVMGVESLEKPEREIEMEMQTK